MTITEAIKILRVDIADPGSQPIEDVNEAEQLGIEALGLVDLLRTGRTKATIRFLPGETPDPERFIGGG